MSIHSVALHFIAKLASYSDPHIEFKNVGENIVLVFHLDKQAIPITMTSSYAEKLGKKLLSLAKSESNVSSRLVEITKNIPKNKITELAPIVKQLLDENFNLQEIHKAVINLPGFQLNIASQPHLYGNDYKILPEGLAGTRLGSIRRI